MHKEIVSLSTFKIICVEKDNCANIYELNHLFITKTNKLKEPNLSESQFQHHFIHKFYFMRQQNNL